MSITLKASKLGLEIVDRARQRKGWTKTRTLAWWQTAHTSQATLRRFWRGIAIDREAFIAICATVGITDWQAIAEFSFMSEENSYLSTTAQTSSSQVSNFPYKKQDWHDSPDLPDFYGREQELNLLETWLVKDGCKLLSILGIGGIGKTSLAIACADRLQDQFDCLIWRSLKSAPMPIAFLQDLLSFFSVSQQATPILSLELGISRLIEYFRQQRCLLVMDGLESIFLSNEGKSKPQTDIYPIGYEGYGEILQRLARGRHQSCVILTSREKFREMALVESESLSVRSLTLRGLEITEISELFEAKGCQGSERELQEIAALYGGNPLALKIVATTIRDVFTSNIRSFLQKNTIIVSDRMKALLKQQVDRLSKLEKEILYWLAIECEPIALTRLQDDLLLPPSLSQLIEALAALERRSLIEKVVDEQESCFTLQPFVMKYLLEELAEDIAREFLEVVASKDTDYFNLFRIYALAKPQCQNLENPNEARLLLRLQHEILKVYQSEKKIQAIFDFLLPQLQAKSALEVGYALNNSLLLKRILSF